MSYEVFARFYDILIQPVDYRKRANYFHRLMQRYKLPKDEVPRILDLGCGTGTLAFALKDLGYQVVGVDKSVDMLAAAREKGEGITFICQDICRLALGEMQVQGAVSALDCLNHVLRRAELSRFFACLYRHICPEGLFLFDVNTPYKHRSILGNHIFVYDTPEVYCVWANETRENPLRTDIWLDLFVPDEMETYQRFQEHFQERAWEREELEEMAEAAGFRVLAVLGGDYLRKVKETDQRAVYVLRRNG